MYLCHPQRTSAASGDLRTDGAGRLGVRVRGTITRRPSSHVNARRRGLPVNFNHMVGYWAAAPCASRLND